MSDRIDTSRAAIEAILEGVTPGPWKVILLDTDGREFDRGRVRSLRGAYFGHAIAAESKHVFLAPHSHADNNHDASFIAWSREAVPALAAERDRLVEENERLREAVAEVDRLRDALTSVLSWHDKDKHASGKMTFERSAAFAKARAALKGDSHE